MEFDSEFARQRVVNRIREELAAADIPFHEIALPIRQPASHVVNTVLARLHALPSGVVSLSGFATAFVDNVPLEDSLRVFNFQRENLARPAVCQIWWLSSSLAEQFVRSVPDLDSWFMVRLHLTEVVAPPAGERGIIMRPTTHAAVNIDDARRRAAALTERFGQALAAGASASELRQSLAIPAVNALLEAGAEREARALEVRLMEEISKGRGSLPLAPDQAGTGVPVPPSSLDEALYCEKEGTKLYHQGMYAQAEPLHQRALTIREQVLGPEHPDTASSLNNLAGLYDHQGLYAQAEPLYQRALAIWEKVLGPEHPDTATSLNNLALLYHHQGLSAQAEPLFQRALAIREQVLGAEHPDTATSLNNLALLYDHQGLYAQAAPLFQRALTISEQVLGPEHPDTATSLNNLAGLYYDQGLYAQAAPLFQRALAIREQVLGPEHPSTATSLNNLAGLYHHQGLYAQAEPLFQRALAIREKSLGSEHPNVALVLENYAGLLRELDREAEAEQLAARARGIRGRKT